MTLHSAALDLLADQQLRAFTNAGRPPTVYDEQWLALWLAQQQESTPMFSTKSPYYERLRNTIRDLPTPYQDPFWFGVLTDLRSKIEASIKQYDVDHGTPTVLPTVYCGSVLRLNRLLAQAIFIEDEYLAIFDSSLFTFVFLFAKGVASCLPLDKLDLTLLEPIDVISHLLVNPECTEAFLDVLLNVLLHSDPGRTRPTEMRGPRMVFAHWICSATELFILGHEYGHIINEHAMESSILLPDHKQPHGTPTSWVQEFEADRVGGVLSSLALQRSGTPAFQSFIGADFFFILATLIYEGTLVLEHGDQEPIQKQPLSPKLEGAYPPNALRGLRLADALREDFDPAGCAAIENIRSTLWTACHYIFRRIEPILLQLHSQGIRPGIKWTV